MSEIGTPPKVNRKRMAGLTLAALGVVFGDIGTSPLYTVKECFSEFTGLKPAQEDVLGILSLITWALIIVVTLKYVLVVMRADNRGEGGVLALMALVSRRAEISPRRARQLYLMLGMAGAALFYGDCLLTPAISVLSAVEGLNIATPALEPLVIPIVARRAGRPVRRPALRHRRRRPLVRTGHAAVVRHPVVLGVTQVIEAPSPAPPSRRLTPSTSCCATASWPSWPWARSPWPSPAPRRSTPTWAISAPSRSAWPG